MSSARDFARLVRAKAKERKPARRDAVFVPVQRMREALREVDGLRVRLPDLHDTVLAYDVDADSSRFKVKSKKYVERPKIIADLSRADFGLNNAVSLAVVLHCGSDVHASKLRERFNVVEIDVRPILLLSEDGMTSVRLTKAEIDDYQGLRTEISARSGRAWYVKRLFDLHLLLHDVVVRHLNDHGNRLCADTVGEHHPVFVVAPRSLDFIVNYPTLPMDALTHNGSIVMDFV